MFKRRKSKRLQQPTDPLVIDTDQENVPLNDTHDPTSLFFMLSMNHGTVLVNWDGHAGLWRVDVGDKGQWSAASQVAALTAAWTDLEGDEEPA
jgi:hypothetical protein